MEKVRNVWSRWEIVKGSQEYMYEDGKAAVWMGDDLSESFILMGGLKQGYVMYLWLFKYVVYGWGP